MDLNLAAAGANYGVIKARDKQKNIDIETGFRSSIFTMGNQPSVPRENALLDFGTGEYQQWLDNYNPAATLDLYRN